MRSRSAIAFALGLVLLAPAAPAEELQIAGRTLQIQPPAGFCALDPARPDESQTLELQQRMQQQQNKLVMVYLECQDLERQRGGAAVEAKRYGIVLASQQQGE